MKKLLINKKFGREESKIREAIQIITTKNRSHNLSILNINKILNNKKIGCLNIVNVMHYENEVNKNGEMLKINLNDCLTLLNYKLKLLIK